MDGLGHLTTLRHQLHAEPELAGDEGRTAARIRDALMALRPDAVITDLGGHGVAALFRGGGGGRPIVVRAELDALPIAETVALPYGSTSDGVAHKCGHDGHMAIAIGVAMLHREARNRGDTLPHLALLFQPAEEIGAGASAVVDDGRLDAWQPAAVLALHNLPGAPLDAVIVRDGAICPASVGLAIAFEGVGTHAATPACGRSPLPALIRTIDGVMALEQGDAAFATVTSVRCGDGDFGIAPGLAELGLTIRAGTDRALESLVSDAMAIADREAAADELTMSTTHHDRFPTTINHAGAVDAVRAAACRQARTVVELDVPLSFSEDVGHLIARYGGAFFGLGAGETHSALHDPSYDFPDELIASGAEILFEAACVLGRAS